MAYRFLILVMASILGSYSETSPAGSTAACTSLLRELKDVPCRINLADEFTRALDPAVIRTITNLLFRVGLGPRMEGSSLFAQFQLVCRFFRSSFISKNNHTHRKGKGPAAAKPSTNQVYLFVGELCGSFCVTWNFGTMATRL